MSRTPQIRIQNLCYQIAETTVNFDQLSLNFQQKKYGIVGDNGVGKTTLLALMANVLPLTQGSIIIDETLAYSPQHLAIKPEESIAEVLNVKNTLQSLQRIKAGSIDSKDYEQVAERWDLEQQISTLFNEVNLRPMDLSKPFRHCSGGEQTKLQMIKMKLSNADFILLDEPTNNLDVSARQWLYQWIKTSNQGFLIVSHDRMLLNQVDEIIELTTKGCERYGGNYDFYSEQKATMVAAAEQALHNKIETLSKTKATIQTRYQRHQQNQAKGERGKKAQIKARGSYDKIAIKSQKGRSESTNRRIRLQADRKLSAINQQLSEAQEKVEIKTSIHADLQATRVANNKVILSVEQLNFAYPAQRALFNNLNLTIIGPKRVALLGDNGSGKTTLIKLILNQLTPSAGNVALGVQHYCYLDQQVDFLEPQLSLLENYQQQNPGITVEQAHFALASMNFRNSKAHKLVKHLSGGERIRAGLAISLLALKPPQFIILDEPTNHLDIRSIEAIETMLRAYQGALLVISHDLKFLERIKIDERVMLSSKSDD